MLVDLLRRLAAGAPLADLLQPLLAGVRTLTECRRAVALALARSGQWLVAAADGHAPIAERDEIDALLLAAAPAVDSGAIVETDDAMRDERFRAIGSRSGMEIRALGAIPLRSAGRALGALAWHDERPRAHADVSAALADLASTAALALELHALRAERAEDETGPTPRAFFDRLATEAARALRHGRPLAYAALWADGEPRATAARLRACLPPDAILSRDDASRWHVLLPDCARDAAAAALLPVGAPAGLACLPEDAVDVETLLLTARDALARAQKSGGVCDFSGPVRPGPAAAPAVPTREARALLAMLERLFGLDLDLRLQLTLSASLLAGATGAPRAIILVRDEDGPWIAGSSDPAELAGDLAALGDHPDWSAHRAGDVVLLAHTLAPAAKRLLACLAPLAERIQAADRVQKRRLETRRRRETLARVLDELRTRHDFSTIVGDSPKILDALQVVVRAAPTDAPVLITGESGTGKELIARAVHANSPRRAGPFVVMNCAAVPPALLESELFGHVKGAFTGAVAERRGLLHSADGGTLFLDEVAETTPEVQAKLLRALQFGEVQRVGSDVVDHVAVRVVAATNKDLAAEVRDRRFREDLFYRINVFRVHLPPLRERPEDIPRLAEAFLRRLSPAKTLDPAAVEALRRYPWPGNVRELENVLTRAHAYAAGGVVAVQDLPEEVARGDVPVEDVLPRTSDELERLKRRARREIADRLEVAFITRALAASKGNVSLAARQTGMNRTSLQKLMAKHGIDADQFRK